MYYFTCLFIIIIINITSNTGKSSLRGLCSVKFSLGTTMYGERLKKKAMKFYSISLVFGYLL